MLQDEEAVTVSADIQKPVIPIVTILVCTGLSILFMNTGILSFFYLVPLGYAIIVSGSFLHTFAIASIAGIIFSIIKSAAGANAGTGIMLEIVYLSVIIFGFTWIMGGKRLREVYRFVIASIAGAIVTLIYINSPQVKFYEYFNEIAASLLNNSSESISDSGSAKGIFGLQMFSPEQMTETAKSFIMRGGALISMFFIFFVNRQIANVFFSIIKKRKKDLGLISFFAPSNIIWVLSGAIATILISGMFKIDMIGILAWNVFTVCVIIYLAQGSGVIMYWLSTRTNIFRLVISVLFVVILFSPISIVALAAVVILGIADIWVSFRIPRNV